MKPYKFFDRAEFVEKRYERFLQKKKWLKETGMDAIGHLTDLDRIYKPFTKPMKDVVICDRCQEDVLDPVIVSLEASFIYHKVCIQHELPAEEASVEPQPEPISNLVWLDDFRNKGNDDDHDPVA